MLAKKDRSIASIFVWGAMIVFALIFIFSAIAIYIEYRDFDAETEKLRREYLEEQKAQIVFDTKRVLRFIKNEYSKRHGKIDEDILKTQIKNSIEELYGRIDGTGYIFIYDFDGQCLSDPIQKQNVGKNLYGFRDPDGVQVIRDLIEVSKRPEGGFVRYTWIKPTTGSRSPKISYAKSFDPWRWMVGTGVYLDEVERVIAQKRSYLEEKTMKSILKMLLLMVTLLVAGFMVARIVDSRIRREVESFNRYFESAAQDHLLIDPDQVRLSEFREMVVHINDMVNEIHKRKKKLKKINLQLERKVAKKTADLRERNRMLAEEKSFSEALLKAQDRFIRCSIHEINTPLAVIMTHIDIFKIKFGQNRYLAKIEAAAKMIATIYDDLAYMVKKNRIEYSAGWLDFSLFAQERIRFFQEIAIGNKHTIVERIEEGIEIFFNDIELQRIIDNNLSNAIKYAKRSTYITVYLFRKKNSVVLEFMSQSKKAIEDTEKIFEEFHREESHGDGLGLGLVIVREICEKNGVEIRVTSDEEYTLFSYTFPVHRKDADEGAAA